MLDLFNFSIFYKNKDITNVILVKCLHNPIIDGEIINYVYFIGKTWYAEKIWTPLGYTHATSVTATTRSDDESATETATTSTARPMRACFDVATVRPVERWGEHEERIA